MNLCISVGVLIAQILIFVGFGNPFSVGSASPHCTQAWNPSTQFIQGAVLSNGVPNGVRVPGYPHPNAAGRADIAACVRTS